MERSSSDRVIQLTGIIADSMRELSELWNDRKVSEWLEDVGGFPFSESFDDVAGNYGDWAYRVRQCFALWHSHGF